MSLNITLCDVFYCASGFTAITSDGSQENLGIFLKVSLESYHWSYFLRTNLWACPPIQRASSNLSVTSPDDAASESRFTSNLDYTSPPDSS